MNAYLDDDENVKAMRDTAHTVGVTALLIDLRRDHLRLLESMDRNRARLTQALVLLGVSDSERKEP